MVLTNTKTNGLFVFKHANCYMNSGTTILRPSRGLCLSGLNTKVVLKLKLDFTAVEGGLSCIYVHNICQSAIDHLHTIDLNQ